MNNKLVTLVFEIFRLDSSAAYFNSLLIRKFEMDSIQHSFMGLHWSRIAGFSKLSKFIGKMIAFSSLISLKISLKSRFKM